MNSQILFDLFNIPKDFYIRHSVWTEDEHYGFSITVKYSENIKFKPVKNNKGEDDSVMLIKVYLSPKTEKDYWINILISKTSLFQLDSFKNNKSFMGDKYTDSDSSPSEKSLRESLGTPQPVDLQSRDKFYLDKENVFYDHDKKDKEIKNPFLLIDYIISCHYKTLYFSGTLLKTKLKIQYYIVAFCRLSAIALIKFHKKISSTAIKNDFYDLPHIPFYEVNEKGLKEKKDFDFKYEDEIKNIKYLPYLFLSFFIFCLYILNFYFCFDFLKIISFFKSNKEDSVFLYSFIVLIYIFISRILPWINLKIINIFIFLYQKISQIKFKIESKINY